MSEQETTSFIEKDMMKTKIKNVLIIIKQFRRFGAAEISFFTTTLVLGFVLPKGIELPLLSWATFLLFPLIPDIIAEIRNLIVKIKTEIK